MMVLVVAFSVLAGFLFAAAAFLQQRSARAAVGDEPTTVAMRGVGSLMRRLVRSRTWLFGWFTNLAGFLSQATALHLGSVVVVQSLLSTQLLFTLPLAAIDQRRPRGRRSRRREWCFALAICAGLAVLLGADGAAPLSGHPDRGRVVLAACAAALLVVLLAGVSSRCGMRVASLLVAIAAGLCFAMSAVFMKLTTADLLDRGVAATAVDWPGYCLAASTIAGLLLEQVAFAGGPLPWAIAAMSVTNPVASFAAGMLAFRVRFPNTPVALAGIVVAGLLVSIGISGLAHSTSTRLFYAGVNDDDGADDDGTEQPKNPSTSKTSP